ncbi:MAG TPA: hypothetical protein VG711_06035, partial [Phycisphaerales bacterium]|nr:hypothetical protein [Phycisphaerales bacterium]
MQQILEELQTIRRKSRWMLVTQRLSLILAGLLLAVVLAVFFDFAIRLPATFRFVLLLTGLIALAVITWKYFLAALDFFPSLTQVALRAEQVLPSVAGRLASGVEFASAGLAESNALAARSVRDLQDRLAGSSLGAVLKKSTTRRDLAIFCIIAAAAILLALWKPAEASIGLTRLFVPFTSEQWPARTGVDSQMYQVLVHGHAFPRGSALPLRALVTRGPNDQPVEAHFRFKKNDRYEDWQTAELTWQGPTVLGGAVHERLIDTSAQAVDVYFTTADSHTETESIVLVQPPAVLRATINIAPPNYASNVASLEAELGPGTDKRAITEIPMLTGSSALLKLTLNKPINPPAGQDEESWLRQTLSWPADQPAPKFISQEEGMVWSLSWPLMQTANFNIRLFDEYGLSNSEPINYRIAAVEDRDPAITITQPQADQPVTAAAIIPLSEQATDDVALTRMGYTADVQRKSALQPATASENPDSVHDWSDQMVLETPRESAAFDSSIDLKPLNLSEGDVVDVTAFAEDVFSLNGAPHHVAQSPPRRLRVMSDVDMATQLRRQFSIIRQNAIRIEAVQAELQDEIAEESIKPGVDRAQAQISERIAAQRQSIEDVQQALKQNRLNDDQLNELVNQARDIAEHAGRAATRATDLIQARANPAPTEPSTEQQNGRGSSEQSSQNQPSGKSNSAQQDSSVTGQQRASQQNGANQQPAGSSQKQSSSGQETSAEQKNPSGKPSPQDAAAAPTARNAEPQPGDKPITEAQQEVRDELADLIQLLDRDEDTWVVTHQLENLIQEQQRLQSQTQKAGEHTVGQHAEDLS